MTRCYNCCGSGWWCSGNCWGRLWRRIRINIQTRRRKEVESYRWAWPFTVEVFSGLYVCVKYFIYFATHGNTGRTYFLQLKNCFSFENVLVLVRAVVCVVVDVIGFVYKLKRRTFECVQGATTQELLCSFDSQTSKIALERTLEELSMRQIYLKRALEKVYYRIF